MNFCLQSYTFCLQFILCLPTVCGSGSVFGIRIRVHKVAEYESNLDPDPQHCRKLLHFLSCILLLTCITLNVYCNRISQKASLYRTVFTFYEQCTVLLIFASQLSRVAAGSTASAVQEVFVVCGGGSIVPSHPAQCVQWANKV